jgi:hypothetical protein
VQVLVHTAIARYGHTDDGTPPPSAADCLCHLFEHDFHKLMGFARHEADAFRTQYCYVEETDLTLKRHAPLLRALFHEYAVGEGQIGDKLKATTLLGFDEWTNMVRDTALVDMQFTQLHAQLAFSWSRMRVVDETSERSRAKQVRQPQPHPAAAPSSTRTGTSTGTRTCTRTRTRTRTAHVIAPFIRHRPRHRPRARSPRRSSSRLKTFSRRSCASLQ